MYDVVVVGTGLAGCLAATLLSRQDHRVALVGRTPGLSAEFRAEQLVGGQVATLCRLGFARVMDGADLHRGARAGRRGRWLDYCGDDHYGMPYWQMVVNAWNGVPPEVTHVYDMATYLEQTEGAHLVHCRECQPVEARLVVLATGLSEVTRFGFSRHVVRQYHSLALGFDLQTKCRTVVTYYGEPRDKISYLAAFQTRRGPRGNLFTYHHPRDEWVTRFRQSPNVEMAHVMPGLEQLIGDYHVAGPVVVRPTSLWQVKGPVRPGVVLVGDAYQTSCPVIGSGIGRLLCDVETLASRATRWLGQGSLGCGAINEYYQDPTKVATDREALRAAEYGRNSVLGTTLGWRLHRQRVLAQRRLRAFWPR
jgi:2-polyprenyl-6-methoxyphenol hydroxylase-like FAD-dependent oxidoreductase